MKECDCRRASQACLWRQDAVFHPERGSPQAFCTSHDPFREGEETGVWGPPWNHCSWQWIHCLNHKGLLGIVGYWVLKRFSIQTRADRENNQWKTQRMPSIYHQSWHCLRNKELRWGKAGSEGHHGDLSTDIGARDLPDTTDEWMNEDPFVEWTTHLTNETECTKEWKIFSLFECLIHKLPSRLKNEKLSYLYRYSLRISAMVPTALF